MKISKSVKITVSVLVFALSLFAINAIAQTPGVSHVAGEITPGDNLPGSATFQGDAASAYHFPGHLDVSHGQVTADGGVAGATGGFVAGSSYLKSDSLSVNGGNSIYVPHSGETGAGNVGIGTATPEFKLSLDNDGGIIAKGTYGSGATLTSSGSGARLIWYPRKWAFRAGGTAENQWDDANIGTGSTAMGGSTLASGDYSFAIGCHTIASGEKSVAMGVSTTASGNYSTAMGQSTTASGLSSTAMGRGTTASAPYSIAMGYLTSASGDYSVAMGRAITAQGNYSFGIGLDSTARTITAPNTMAIMGGNVGIGTTSPTQKLDVDGYVKGRTGLCIGNDCRTSWPPTNYFLEVSGTNNSAATADLSAICMDSDGCLIQLGLIHYYSGVPEYGIRGSGFGYYFQTSSNKAQLIYTKEDVAGGVVSAHSYKTQGGGDDILLELDGGAASGFGKCILYDDLSGVETSTTKMSLKSVTELGTCRLTIRD